MSADDCRTRYCLLLAVLLLHTFCLDAATDDLLVDAVMAAGMLDGFEVPHSLDQLNPEFEGEYFEINRCYTWDFPFSLKPATHLEQTSA